MNKFACILADIIRVGYHAFIFCMYIAAAFGLMVVAVVGGYSLCEMAR